MPLLTYTVPTLGLPNSTEDAKVQTALSAIKSEYNATIAAQLGAYSPICIATGSVGVFAAGTAGFDFGTGAAETITGVNMNGSIHPVMFYLSAASIAVTGYTTKIRTRFLWMTNSTAPAQTVTAGIYPLTTFTGAAGVISATMGTVVTGTTAAIASPSANNSFTTASTDVSLPSDGTYVPGVTYAGAAAASSAGEFIVSIEIRYV